MLNPHKRKKNEIKGRADILITQSLTESDTRGEGSAKCTIECDSAAEFHTIY